MKLSIIIGSRNEVPMLSVTVRSALEELKAIDNDGEVVICDNSDPEYESLLKGVIPTQYMREKRVKFITQKFPCLFTAREQAVKAAEGEYILCLDAHMLVGRDMFKDLVNFADALSAEKKAKFGFAHAPINWAHQHESRGKHDRDMSKHELGDWGAKYNHVRKITWKGMPWLCRREWFMKELGGYGALSQHKLSWGGGDMHIGIKPLLLGYENWAVPTSPGIHMGPFPGDRRDLARYRTYSVSGATRPLIGFLVSSYVLGGEEMIKRNLPNVEARYNCSFQSDVPQAIEFGKDERAWLLKRQKISFDELLVKKPWEERV